MSKPGVDPSSGISPGEPVKPARAASGMQAMPFHIFAAMAQIGQFGRHLRGIAERPNDIIVMIHLGISSKGLPECIRARFYARATVL